MIREGTLSSSYIIAKTINGKKYVATGNTETGYDGYTWHEYHIADNSGTYTRGWSSGHYLTGGIVTPTVTISATDADASETGPDTGTFTVSRTGSTTSSLTVYYSMGGTATNGSDYSSLSGSATIPSGSSSATITVSPIDDTAVEGSETAIATLSTNANYTIGSPNNATINIADNDGVTIGEAVDNTTLFWTTGGSTNWFGQNTVYYFGGDAAQSGDIADNQTTYVQTTVTGPGTLTFYWKVSSESSFDYLRFYIDGTEQTSITGEVSWQQKTYSISSGTHTLKWAYTKDSSVSMGSDAGWLDYVTFNSGQTYILSVTKSGTGSGTVTSSPTGIDCGTDCSEPYNSGTGVTLTATPSTGSTFAGWSGDSDCSDGYVTMNASKTCNASFNTQSYTLSVTKSGTGSGTVTSNPTGINCGTDCSEAYSNGTGETLTATPASGSTFAGWSGDSDCSDGYVTMNASKTCNAAFTTTKTWFEETDSAVTYTNTWTNYSCGGCSAGAVKYSKQTNATATLSFTGTGVKWYAAKAKMLGIAKVYIDGVLKTTVDLYSATSQVKQVVYQITGLASGNHTIKIEVTGTKNASATNTYIDIDAFEITP
ncbi:MAG: hypothetical protein HY880_03640 [Deltaproteobacteria bacterium]|nr:hypothetical protein [Deltaproteobacteria bacterium]